jgi:site-specific recombinase XerD
MRRLVKRAGVGRVTPHMLRHGFATQLVRNGVDIETVRQLMGHASIAMTVQYLHSDTRTKERAVASLSHLLS